MVQESTLKVKRSHGEFVNNKILQGDSLLRSERYQEALEAYKAAIDVNPETSRLYVYAAQALMGLHNYEGALKYVNQGLAVNSTNPLICIIAGEVHRHLKNWDEALKYFQEASRLDSSSVVSYFGMGQVFHQRQQYDEAIEMFRKALTLDRRYRKAYAGITNAYLAKIGKQEEIVDIQDDVLDPVDQSAHIQVIEEDDLTKMFGSTTHEELEEQLAEIRYIAAWLQALLEEFRWQANYIKEAIEYRERYMTPQVVQKKR